MNGEWSWILERYGQSVTVVQDGRQTACMAFLQPALETGTDWFQNLPTPLGETRRDRWLYLGPADVALTDFKDGYVAWAGFRFDLRAAQPVCVGDETVYWWGLLAPRAREETEGDGET